MTPPIGSFTCGSPAIRRAFVPDVMQSIQSKSALLAASDPDDLYRALDQRLWNVEHGIAASHYNIYKANQAPRNSPHPYKCSGNQ